MRDIVASIHPRHAQAILDGTKTVELRRKVWRMGAEIDRMFLYETAPTSALVGHVRVGVCRTMPPDELWDATLAPAPASLGRSSTRTSMGATRRTALKCFAPDGSSGGGRSLTSA
jgi:predicted transcriptional regulator